MYTRFFALIVALAGLVTATMHQPAAQSATQGKVRLNDSPTPGWFGGLRTQPPAQVDIDASSLQVSLPNRWLIDPVTKREYKPGEVLVRFRGGMNSARRAAALAAGRARRVAYSLPGNWNLVELEPGADTVDSAAALRARSEILQAYPNYRRYPFQVRPNDTFFDLQWNFDAINLPSAWQINPGARSDVTVAVIDTGLNTVTNTFSFPSPVGTIALRFAAVPDLVRDDNIVSPRDFVYNDALPLDLDGHGTHVTGTIAQQTNNSFGLAGIAYNVKLMPIKALGTDWDDIFFPNNPGGSDAIVAAAIQYAADNGAKVINLSLGGPGESPALLAAIEYAVSKGAFVSIAAGNSAEDGNPEEFPAGYGPDVEGAMTVGAINRSLRRADYSSFHPYVEICAPGGEITSFVDYERGVTQVGYEEESTLSFSASLLEKLFLLNRGFRPQFDRFVAVPLQGTSMAAPHIAGVAALLYSQGIRNPAAIEQAIKRFARPIDASADECGAGLVDSRRALRGLGLAR
jgi:serine protease